MNEPLSLRGRRAELAVIDEYVAGLISGTGGTVIIEGDAGQGKTSLIRYAMEAADAAGLSTGLGTADQMKKLVVLAPLLDALVAFAPPLVDRAALRRLTADINDRYWVLDELRDRLDLATRTRPVVIAIDDLQWCDELTHVLLRTLPARLAHAPILWLFGVRAEDRTHTVQVTMDAIERAAATRLPLSTLTSAAALEVARDVLGHDADESLASVVGSGLMNTFELVEYLRGVSEEAPGSRFSVPQRYASVIEQRLSALSEGTRRLVLAMSVFGTSIDTASLCVMLECRADQLVGPLQEAITAGLIDERGEHIEFRHDLLRDAVYRSIPRNHVAVMQRAAFAALAKHSDGPAGRERMAGFADGLARPGDLELAELLSSTARALEHAAPDEAARLSHRAAQIAPSTATVVEAARFAWRGQFPQLAAQLSDHAISGMSDLHASALLRLEFAALALAHSFAEAVEQCVLGLELEQQPSAVRARLLALQCLALLNCGFGDRAAVVAPQALEAARAAGDVAAEVLALACQSTVAWYRSDHRATQQLADEAVQLARRSGPAATELWDPEIWKSMVLTSHGDYDEAVNLARGGVVDARRQKDASSLRLWNTLRARVLLDAEKIQDARAEAEAALAMSDDIGRSNWADATATYTAGRASLMTDLVRPDDVFDRLGELSQSQLPLLRRGARWVLALDAFQAGRPDEAFELASEGFEARGRLEPMFAMPHDPVDDLLFIEIALGAGRLSEAEQMLEVIAGRAGTSTPSPIAMAVEQHARGLFTSDVALLHEAAKSYSIAGRPLAQALALEHLARLAIQKHETDAAVAHLVAAIDLTQHAGAAAASARRRRLIAELDGQPASLPAPLAEHRLTVSEMRVAELVARGATNREVASQLFLSPHTVDSHLRHVFAKLEVRSRVQLAARMSHEGRQMDGAVN
jgi:DNA-binding CsgD family transcriptional regulator/tetratricopeptide (TPR) repeat protein